MIYIAAVKHFLAKLGDVSTAFLHARLPKDEPPVIVRPPPNLQRKGWLWRLVRALYGLRTSPRLFQEHLVAVVGRAKWKRLVTDAQAFVHEETGSLMLVHADDIFLAGPVDMIPKLCKALDVELKIKWGKELTPEWDGYLGRQWREENDTLYVWIPPHYWRATLVDAGLDGCRPVVTPCEVQRGEDDTQALNPEDATRYRHLVGRLLWTTAERPDIDYAAKKPARHVQAPTERC